MSKNNADFKQTLWKTADSLRAQMDAAEYKHIVLSLIFLKYISDSFTEQKEKIKEMVTNPDSDLFISENLSNINEQDLEDRDYYTQDNVFWVPGSARWETLRDQAKQPNIGEIIDRAMGDIESENKSLKGKLDKRFGRTELSEGTLGKIIDLISTIGFTNEDNRRDILGEVYEYFLGQFALAEGKKGGQFYTPRNVVQLLVDVIEPFKGRVYDPCCGSGGMFVLSDEFVISHGGKRDDISIYGQESNPTTWRLASMNLAIRGMSADMGEESVDTFSSDQHRDKKFDFILMNPFFNDSDWGGEKYQDDLRWKYGTPPENNANFAWIQHVINKMSDNRKAGIVLANNTMTAGKIEGEIRRRIIEDDLIEAVVTLPKKLFLNFKGSVCIWYLSKNKKKNSPRIKDNILFIDARELGEKINRSLVQLNQDHRKKISDTIKSWRQGKDYQDVSNFCKSVRKEDVIKKDSLLLCGIHIDYEDETDEVDSDFIQSFQDDNELLKKEIVEHETKIKGILELLK